MVRISPQLRDYSQREILSMLKDGRVYLQDDTIVPTIKGAAAPPLSNNFDGGTSGNNIATTDTGSGDPWNATAAAVGATIKYSNARSVSAPNSMEIVQSTTSGDTYVAWTGLGSITSGTYYRIYAYTAALPNGAAGKGCYVIAVRNNAGSAAGYIKINLAGHIEAENPANTPFITGTAVIPLNEFIRIEAHFIASTTVGQAEWRLFSSVSPGDGFNGTTPTESMSSTATQVLGANIDQVRWGHGSSNDQITSQTWNFDEPAISTAGWIGPAVAPPETIGFLRPARVRIRSHA